MLSLHCRYQIGNVHQARTTCIYRETLIGPFSSIQFSSVHQSFPPHRSCVFWWNTGWCFMLKVRHVLEWRVWLRPLLPLQAASDERIIKIYHKQTWTKNFTTCHHRRAMSSPFSFSSSASPNNQSNEFLKLLAFQTKSKAIKGISSSASHQQHVQCSCGNKNSNISILEKAKPLCCCFPFAWKEEEDTSQCLISCPEISWKIRSESRSNIEKAFGTAWEICYLKEGPWRWAIENISKDLFFSMYLLEP